MGEEIKLETNSSLDPIYIDAGPGWQRDSVCVRIGGHGRGEGRYCLMSPGQAKIVGHTLPLEAERLDQRLRRKRRKQARRTNDT